MSEIRVDSIGNESNTGGPVLSGITTFSGQQYFIPPKGTTAERPSDCPPGSIRFNTDSAHLEYWQGTVWLEFEASSVELGDQNQTNSAGGTGYRGLIAGGILNAPAYTNAINYITISTLGDSQDFGDLSDGRSTGGSLASSTRCFWAGGYSASGFQNNIQYVTISSTGDTEDFGDLSVHGSSGRMAAGGLSNSTRGLFVSGQNSPGSPYFTDGISYITLASNGNDIDFGDAAEAGSVIQGMASPVRGVYQQGAGNPKPIYYVTISTQGNALDFGSLSQNIGSVSAASNSVRGIFAGGYISNRIDYVTIASTGNAQDFGDLTQARFETVGMSSPTRAVFGAGTNSPGTPLIVNTMDYLEIMTTGNAVEFGDVTYGTSGTGRHPKGSSNGHGGLS